MPAIQHNAVASIPYISALDSGSCLAPTAASDIITRYFAARTATDLAAIPSLVTNLVTENFTYTDETLNFSVGPCVAPPEGPVVFNREIFIGFLTLVKGESTITEENFEVLDTIIECEKIAVRWQGSGKAIGKVLPNM
jgi:hypothetical protein